MALPDDDGTQAAQVAQFKRKRRIKLGAFAVLALLGLAVGTVFVASLFQTTSFDEELQLIQQWSTNPTEHANPEALVPGLAHGRATPLGLATHVTGV